MFKHIMAGYLMVFPALSVCVLAIAECYAQEHGSAESRRKRFEQLLDYSQLQQRAKDEATALEVKRKHLVELGSDLFGTHKYRAEVTYAVDKMSNGNDYKIGDWGFLRNALKTISRVSNKEYLVLCEGKGEKVILLRGFDMTKVTDGIEFILSQPVAFKTTYTYETVTGGQRTVLVAESSDSEIEKAIARLQEEKVQRLAAAELKRVEEEKRLQAEMEQRRQQNIRTWTNVTSGETMTAQFISKANDKVNLKRQDGSVFAFLMKDLSNEDQEWIRNRAKGKQVQKPQTQVESASKPESKVASKPESATLAPLVPKDDTKDDATILLGKWVVSVGSYRATWTFLKNGTVMSTAGTKSGTWKLEKERVYIAWEKQAWESFNCPLTSGHTTGDSWQGKGIVAARKLTEEGR